MNNQSYDSDSYEEGQYNNKFNLNIINERQTWWEIIYGKYIPKATCWRKSKYAKFSIIEENNICNPIIFCCNNYKCRSRHSLRYNTFFDKFPKTSESILLEIIVYNR